MKTYKLKEYLSFEQAIKYLGYLIEGKLNRNDFLSVLNDKPLNFYISLVAEEQRLSEKLSNPEIELYDLKDGLKIEKRPKFLKWEPHNKYSPKLIEENFIVEKQGYKSQCSVVACAATESDGCFSHEGSSRSDSFKCDLVVCDGDEAYAFSDFRVFFRRVDIESLAAEINNLPDANKLIAENEQLKEQLAMIEKQRDTDNQELTKAAYLAIARGKEIYIELRGNATQSLYIDELVKDLDGVTGFSRKTLEALFSEANKRLKDAKKE